MFRGLPARSATALTAFLITSFQVLPTDHLVRMALLLASLSRVAWPVPMARLASVARRRAPTEPRIGLRLRLMAGVLCGLTVTATVGLCGMTTVYPSSLPG